MKLDKGTQMPGMYKQDIKGNLTAITVEIPENVRVSNLLDLVSLLNIDRLIHKHDDSLVVDMLCLKIEARVDGSHDRSVADLLMAEVDTIRTNRMGILEVVTSCDMSVMQNYLDWHREYGYGTSVTTITKDEYVKKVVAGEITECPHCGAKFEEDDFAYAIETGLCQYCHQNVGEEKVPNMLDWIRDSMEQTGIDEETAAREYMATYHPDMYDPEDYQQRWT